MAGVLSNESLGEGSLRVLEGNLMNVRYYINKFLCI